MAKLSTPNKSASIVMRHIALLISGLGKAGIKLLQADKRRYRFSLFAILILLISFGASSQHWFSKAENENEFQANSKYEVLALQNLKEGQNSDSRPVISGWVTSFNESQSVESFKMHAKQMNEVLPFWYELNQKGTISEIPGIKKKNETLTVARNNKVAVIPTVTNQFDADRVSRILDNINLRNETIAQLVKLADTEQYDGWDIDWEQLYEGDRGGFTAYISDLATALHAKNKTLSISVPVPSTAIRTTDQAGGFDYKNLTAVVDRVRVMAYDYHGGNSAPGPITPLDEYEATLETIVKIVPKNKLSIALPTYGYDWSKTKGEGIQFDQVAALLKEKRVSAIRDKNSSELNVHYPGSDGTHNVWYNDSESMQALIKIAHAYDIDHFTLWRLGGEDSDFWKVLDQGQ